MKNELQKFLSLMMILVMVSLPVQNVFSEVMINSGSQSKELLSMESEVLMSSSNIDDCCDQEGCKASHCASCGFISSPLATLGAAQNSAYLNFLVFQVSPHKSQLRSFYRPPRS